MCLFCTRNEERIVVNFLGRFFPSSCLSLHDEKRERFKFFYLQKTPINLLRKKDKKGHRQTQRRRNEHKKERSLFLLVGQTKKRTKKQEGKKDRITPPQARLYISKSPILYYRHKSSSRSVAGAKTRKRRLFSGGVDFFAGFNRARL